MLWIFLIVGTILGGVAAGWWGAVVGGALGYLFSRTQTDHERFWALEQKLQKLETGLALAEQKIKDSFGSKTTKEEPSTTAPAPTPAAVKETTLDLDLPGLDLSEPDFAPEAVQSQVSPSAKRPVASAAAAMSARTTAPKEPELIDKAIDWVKRYFTEGNVIVRVGVVVMFFGLSFLVKYSIDNALLPIEYRVVAIGLAAIALLVFGWRLRLTKAGYGLVLQGSGIAVLYLLTFASYRLYDLIPAGITFPLLIFFSLLGMTLAVIQNSRTLAVIAIAGGFVSPILASSGGGSHVALFAYYLVLNVSIFGVAWFKSWRLLNVVGFAFTFVIGALWGVTQYSSQDFATTEPFLVIYFLLYVAISILFATKQKPELKGYVDGTLVFGVPFLGSILQAALVNKFEYGLAYSAAAMGVFYLVLAKALWNRDYPHFRLLGEVMLVLGVIFSSLTVPFAFDGQLTAATWAIEGAGFIWIGLRQSRPFIKYFGVALQLGGALLFLVDMPYGRSGYLFLNTEYLGVFIVSCAGIVSSYLLNGDKQGKHSALRLDIVFLVMAIIWWYLGAVIQLERYLSSAVELAAAIAFFSVSALLWTGLSLHFKWRLASFHPWLLVTLLGASLIVGLTQSHLFARLGFIVWPFALVVCYMILYINDKKQYALRASTALHSASFLLVTAVMALALATALNAYHFVDCWQVAGFIVPVLLAMGAINYWHKWPASMYKNSYQKIAAIVLLAVMLIWSIKGNFFMFLTPAPWPYIPLLNPIDILQGAALLLTVVWLKKYAKDFIPKSDKFPPRVFIGGFCFIWFNSILFKTLHITTGVPYQAEALFNSSIVQMSVSVAWSIIGLAAMVVAARINRRPLWMLGAGLAGIVVAKLFLVDLSERETVERIISFLVVGFLLLIIGYFSPMPPKNTAPETTE